MRLYSSYEARRDERGLPVKDRKGPKKNIKAVFPHQESDGWMGVVDYITARRTRDL